MSNSSDEIVEPHVECPFPECGSSDGFPTRPALPNGGYQQGRAATGGDLMAYEQRDAAFEKWAEGEMGPRRNPGEFDWERDADIRDAFNAGWAARKREVVFFPRRPSPDDER